MNKESGLANDENTNVPEDGQLPESGIETVADEAKADEAKADETKATVTENEATRVTMTETTTMESKLNKTETLATVVTI